MSGSLFLRRRWLIGALALDVLALSTMWMWSSVPRAAPRSEDPHERMRKKLISLLHEPERARQAGAFYLRPPPGRLAPPLKLIETVLAETGPDAGNDAIRGYIAARIGREFREVQVISLDGWIMSPTEAELCALAARGAGSS